MWREHVTQRDLNSALQGHLHEGHTLSLPEEDTVSTGLETETRLQFILASYQNLAVNVKIINFGTLSKNQKFLLVSAALHQILICKLINISSSFPASSYLPQ